MDVSVIIPTHNRAHTLERALSSIFNQTSMPTEILVIDDGSSDDTKELLRTRFSQCRYLRQENRGVSQARNRGIHASRSEWVAFLDSDDEWLPGKLAAQTQALRHHPQHLICHTEEIWMRNGKRVNPMKKHTKSGGHIFRQCLPRCVISPSSVMIHRTLFQKTGFFDEELPACEDYDLWLRICARHPVLFVDTPHVIKHGGHEDQLSRRFWGMDRFRVRALEKVIDSTVLSEPDRNAAIDMLIRKAGILAQGAEKRGKTEQARLYRRKQQNYQTRYKQDT